MIQNCGGRVDNFINRIRACDSTENLERLHLILNKTVAASQRKSYISLLNLKEEELMKRYYSEQSYLNERR